MGRKDKSLEDKAHNYLHDMIIQHKLQAGKRIIESDIADCLGMSHRCVLRCGAWRSWFTACRTWGRLWSGLRSGCSGNE